MQTPRVVPLFCREEVYLGGRDVEICNCRSDCTLRLRSVCNSSLTSLLARGKCIAVHGQCLSDYWSSPHSNERCGRSSPGRTPRLSAWLLRLRRVQQSVSLRVWHDVPAVWLLRIRIRTISAMVRVWIRVPTVVWVRIIRVSVPDAVVGALKRRDADTSRRHLADMATGIGEF